MASLMSWLTIAGGKWPRHSGKLGKAPGWVLTLCLTRSGTRGRRGSTRRPKTGVHSWIKAAGTAQIQQIGIERLRRPIWAIGCSHTDGILGATQARRFALVRLFQSKENDILQPRYYCPVSHIFTRQTHKAFAGSVFWSFRTCLWTREDRPNAPRATGQMHRNLGASEAGQTDCRLALR